MTVLSFEGLTVNELKEILRESELPVSGTKAQLIERLQANHPEANAINLDSDEAASEIPMSFCLHRRRPRIHKIDCVTYTIL